MGLSSYALKIPNDVYTRSTPWFIQHSVNSDWLFKTQSKVLKVQADWLLLENNEKATLNINMPYRQVCDPPIVTFRFGCIHKGRFSFGLPISMSWQRYVALTDDLPDM